MDKEDIRGEIRRQIKDTTSDTSLQRWSNTVLNDRMTMVHEEMCALAGMLEKRATDTNIVSGTAEYSVPDDFIREIRVLYKNASGYYVPLDKKTITELDLFGPHWRDQSGTPQYFYIRDTYIGLYPKPDTARTGGLRLDYTCRAPDLSTDASIPFNSKYEFYFAHIGIAFGVARLCMLDEEKFDASDRFENKYGFVIKGIMRQVSQKSEDIRVPNVYEREREIPRRTS